MLADVDAVVCDLQDLGVRCYTYLATLRNMLEACAEADVEAGEDDTATTAAAPVGKPQDADAALVEKVVRQILLELHK